MNTGVGENVTDGVRLPQWVESGMDKSVEYLLQFPVSDIPHVARVEEQAGLGYCTDWGSVCAESYRRAGLPAWAQGGGARALGPLGRAPL